MKFTVVLLVCVLILVKELSAAPAKDKKVKTDDKSSNHKSKDITDKKDKKQYIPGVTYGNTYDNTYSTGYSSNPYGTGAALVDKEQDEIFNKPVQLVGIKDLKIKNGVIKQSNLVQG